MLTWSEPERADEAPRERLRRKLFNLAHSAEAFLAGVDLALLLDQPPLSPGAREPEGGHRYAFLGWPTYPAKGVMRLATAYVSIADLRGEDLAAIGSHEDVLMARPQLPRGIWDALERKGYWREIPGDQYRNRIYGWQAETLVDARRIRDQRLSCNPTLGLLPSPGLKVEDAPCLALVEVNYQWLVLSEIGLHGRTGGRRLLAGESIFMASDEESGWLLCELTLDHLVSLEEVSERWGIPAADRARPDVPSVAVTACFRDPQ
jgi:hypothetical protein